METSKKKMLVRSLIVGGAIGIVVSLKAKPPITNCVKDCFKTTTNLVKFINENRGEVMTKIRNTSDKLTKAIDETNNDLKAISDNIKHLKNNSSEMVVTVRNTKNEILSMYEDCKQQKIEKELTIQNLEQNK